MKINLLYLFLILSICFLYSCNSPKLSAKQYHTQIKTAVDTLIPYFISLDDDIALDSTAKVMKHYQKLEQVVDHAQDYIDSKDGFEEDALFYNKTKDLIHFYNDYTHHDIYNVILLLEKNPTDLDIKENARVVFIKFYEKEQNYLNEFNKASVDFTYKYKIYKVKS